MERIMGKRKRKICKRMEKKKRLENIYERMLKGMIKYYRDEGSSQIFFRCFCNLILEFFLFFLLLLNSRSLVLLLLFLWKYCLISLWNVGSVLGFEHMVGVHMLMCMRVFVGVTKRADSKENARVKILIDIQIT